MKTKLVPFITCFILSNFAYADDIASLKIHLTGAIKSDRYLCIDGEGCINIKLLGNKTIPIKQEDIQRIYLANLSNYRVYPQVIDKSCMVSVQNNQTVTFSGTVHEKNGAPVIQNMHCKIANTGHIVA